MALELEYRSLISPHCLFMRTSSLSRGRRNAHSARALFVVLLGAAVLASWLTEPMPPT